MGADTVWKLRKAVRLPFLDFTPLAERERTTRRERELNAPHAPGLYRDVVPVTRRPGGAPVLGGDGEVIDWVLRMASVPAGDFLDRRAAAAAGHAVIADGMFFGPDQRAAIEAAAGATPFHGFWLAAPMAELEARVAARTADASDADLSVLRRAAKNDPGPGAWHLVRAGNADDPVAQMRSIMRHNNTI